MIRICGVTGLERITNEDIRRIMEIDRYKEENILNQEKTNNKLMNHNKDVKRVIAEIDKKRLKWCGYIKRMKENRLFKKILEPTTNSKSGRSLKVWLKQNRKDMGRRNLEEGDWKNREAWRI